MGYRTFFELTIHDANTFPKDGSELSESEQEEIFNNSNITKIRNISFEMLEESIKWYEFEEDMIEMSKENDNYVFVLHGDGEDSDDCWKCIFYQGKKECVNKIQSFPPINLSKLGLTDPDDYSPPEPKPLEEYFWNKE